MSTFGKYGVGGRVPGKYPMPSDDNSGAFDMNAATDGTDDGQPDCKPEAAPSTFGSPAHNPAV